MAKSLIATELNYDSNAGQGILLDISEKMSKTEKNIATKLQNILGHREKTSLKNTPKT